MVSGAVFFRAGSSGKSRPTTMPLRKSPHWTMTGLSKPSAFLVCSCRAGEQFFPHAKRAGSMGLAKKSRNVTRLITIIRMKPDTSLRRMYALTTTTTLRGRTAPHDSGQKVCASQGALLNTIRCEGAEGPSHRTSVRQLPQDVLRSLHPYGSLGRADGTQVRVAARRRALEVARHLGAVEHVELGDLQRDVGHVLAELVVDLLVDRRLLVEVPAVRRLVDQVVHRVAAVVAVVLPVGGRGQVDPAVEQRRDDRRDRRPVGTPAAPEDVAVSRRLVDDVVVDVGQRVEGDLEARLLPARLQRRGSLVRGRGATVVGELDRVRHLHARLLEGLLRCRRVTGLGSREVRV